MNFSNLLARLASVSVITSTVTFGVSFAFTVFATKADFGVYSLIQSVLMILINLIPFGTTMSFVVYLHRLDTKEYQELFNVGMFLVIPTTSFFTGCVFFIVEYFVFFDLNISIIIIVVISYCASSVLAIVAYYRATQRIRIYSYLYVFYIAIYACSPLAGYLLTNDIKLSYLISCFTLIIVYIFFIYTVQKEINFELKLSTIRRLYIQCFKYGLPVVLSSVGMSIMVVGDRILFKALFGLEFLPDYALAALISSTALFLVNNFASAWGVYLSKYLSNTNYDEIVGTYNQYKRKLIFILPLYIACVFVQITFYKLVYEYDFPNLEYVIAILTLGYFFYLCSKFYMGYMNFYRKNNMVFVSCCVGIIGTVTILYLFSSSNPLKTISSAVMIGFVFQLAFCFIYTNIFLNKGVKSDLSSSESFF
jgi:O-antigen/teichoic acid export membrane protein